MRRPLRILFGATPCVSAPFLAGFLCLGPAQAQDGAPQTAAANPLAPMRDVVDRSLDAVVHVYVRIQKAKDRFGRDWFKDENDMRSGVVVSPTGTVLTHWSVAAEALGADGEAKPGHSIWIQLRDGATHEVEVKKRDERLDLALLKIKNDTTLAPFSFLPIAAGEPIAPGALVAAIGFHNGESQSAFVGTASGAHGGCKLESGTAAIHELILSDASIRPENHGGPLVDAAGRVVGLCNASNWVQLKPDMTKEELAKPSFGVGISAATIRFALGTDDVVVSKDAPVADPGAWAVARAAKAVVSVHVGRERPDLQDADPLARVRRPGQGSGVIVDPAGYVVTNAHLIRDPGGDGVFVTLPGGRTIPATVKLRDAGWNLALLEIDGGGEFPAAPLGRSDQVTKGERVFALGNPRGESVSTGVGFVSAINRRARVGAAWRQTPGLLQVDAPVHPGNSGGPVIDSTGRVLGVLNAGESDAQVEDAEDKKETNIGFAIPIDRVKDVIRAEIACGTDAVPEGAPERESAVTKLAREAAASLVNVYVAVAAPKQDTFDPFADDEETMIPQGLGSGVIVDPNGLALTNWHVIDGADNVHVRTGTGVTYPAKVLSSSRVDDLALLQLELPAGETVRAVELGNSGDLPIGSTVVAVGNPYGHANTVTVGVLSAKDQGIRIKGRARRFEGLLQTDAAINPGNSGGALLDLDGRLVGINSAGSNADAEAGYAIPVDMVRDRFHGKLLSAEKLQSVYLGVEVGDGESGPEVQALDPYGPAARAGVVVGDLVKSVAGQPVMSKVDFVRTSLAAQVGTPFEIEVLRGGKSQRIGVEPMGFRTWRVFRQTGVAIETVDFAEEAELIRNAQIAAYRHYIGDASAEPPSIERSAVRVAFVREVEVENGLDLEAGDVLIGVARSERLVGGGVSSRLVSFRTVPQASGEFDAMATKEGLPRDFLVYRDGAVITVPIKVFRVQ